MLWHNVFQSESHWHKQLFPYKSLKTLWHNFFQRESHWYKKLFPYKSLKTLWHNFSKMSHIDIKKLFPSKQWFYRHSSQCRIGAVRILQSQDLIKFLYNMPPSSKTQHTQILARHHWPLAIRKAYKHKRQKYALSYNVCKSFATIETNQIPWTRSCQHVFLSVKKGVLSDIWPFFTPF